ncbi:phage minor head protein [Ursidibacter arcticus]
MPKISGVFGLEPEQAVAFLRQKKMLAGKVDKKQLYQSALARATTISRMSSLDMTKDIYSSLERAMAEGKPLAQWKKEFVKELERKGWVVGHDKKISRGIDGKLLADPKTGEYFGTPRRLNTIYRVNMQTAYAAGRYQRMMENIDARPYWQYSAVGDERTRPAHLALNGRIYRYDDPFWTTFYPPNGFNCRCTVIALDERNLKRKGIESVESSDGLLQQVKRAKDKQGNQEETVGFTLADGRVLVTDKGFDYNVGRLTYKPNLDLYPEKLAHQFAKAEMSGAEFKLKFAQVEQQIVQFKQGLGVKGKLSAEQMVAVRDNLTMNFKFAAGRLSEGTQRLIDSKTATVWLSDDTLIKQFNSREGQDFGAEMYADLPVIVFQPDHILQTKEHTDRFIFIKDGLAVVFKRLNTEKEIFLLSFRKISQKELRKLMEKENVLR